MRNKIQQKTTELLQNGYEFKWKKYLEEGFRIFNEFPFGFSIYVFLYAMIVLLVSRLPSIGDILNLLISTPMLVGLYIVAHRIQKNEPYEFNDFFRGFEHFGPLVTTNIFNNIILIIVSVPFFYAIGDFMETLPKDIESFDIRATWESFPKRTLFLLIPTLYLTIGYMFAYKLVLFYNLSAWEALETSRKIITKNWLSFFVFGILLAFLAASGFLFFIVGFFLTIALSSLCLYAAFADITGLLEEKEGDVIDHLVDD